MGSMRTTRLVLETLHPSAPPFNESRKSMDEVLDSLFRREQGEGDHRYWSMDFRRIPPPSVTNEELHGVFKSGISEICSFRDGFPGTVLVMVVNLLGYTCGALFCACLRKGKFPAIWKIASLVLVPKEGWDQRHHLGPSAS